VKARIVGIDVARALAVIGMIIVNFKIVLGENGLSWVISFTSVFDGKAAAIFVVLAGLGLALMTNSALRNKDSQQLKTAQIKIVKRALFLFIVGLSYVIIWPADILHFYGIYMLVIMLFGFWFGKQDLNSDRFVKKAFWVSSIAFVAIQILSHSTISLLSEGNEQTASALTEIIGTNPMPPLPIYMFNGIAISISIISACIIIGKRFSSNKTLLALNKTGQLALTFYVAHVIIGMGIIGAINPEKMGNYPIEFSVGFALLFSLLCIVFATFCLKQNKNGPLEWIMKKIIG
jgi:uncharacterized membrane protein YeiB